MKPLVRLLARLYPRSWRARYGPEFDALVEDAEPRWTDVLNVLNGALIMQIRSAGIPAALTLSGAIAGLLISFTQTKQYESFATVRVHATDSDGIRAILEPKLSAAVAANHVDAERVQVLIDTRSKSETTTVKIGSVAPEAAAAQHKTVKLLESLLAANTEKPGPGLPPIEALSPPSLPTAAASPNRLALAGTGGGLGLIVGGILAWRRRRWRA